MVKLFFLWLAAAIIVFGPYCAIVYGIPWLVESQGWTAAQVDSAKLSESINPHYWIFLAVYLAVSLLFTPTYDPDNLGLFGSKWFDNPLSLEDDRNRAMRSLYQFLLPGKLVWVAFLHTWAVLRHVSGSPRGD